MAHEDELLEWKHSRVGIMSFYAIICAISISAFFILRALVLCTLNPRPAEDYRKAFLMASHALLAVGLSLINYGLLTPSLNGVGIAVFGSMVAFPTMFSEPLIWTTNVYLPEDNGIQPETRPNEGSNVA
ncbi:hypothetical protein BKA61DRAFT_670973 [Leptodontidium sp. MPI-SDFR-AT-0119]|nr:hypothetical protein BKA61DRAFT_670973 [Leptodontidium sp. MPI-SDFR-AT-0119]